MGFGTKKDKVELVKSSFLSDIYVGKNVNIDKTAKLLLPGTIFEFPENFLTVKNIYHYQIDKNNLEEIDFEKQGTKEYMLVVDAFNNTDYLFNLLMIQNTDAALQDTVTLDDGNGKSYDYKDFSGLIKITIEETQQDQLIRIYERILTEKDNEYCLIRIKEPSKIEFWIGFCILPKQLENI